MSLEVSGLREPLIADGAVVGFLTRVGDQMVLELIPTIKNTAAHLQNMTEKHTLFSESK